MRILLLILILNLFTLSDAKSQLDSIKWVHDVNDSLVKLNKPIVSIGVFNSGFDSDISNKKGYTYPGHIRNGAKIELYYPLKEKWGIIGGLNYINLGDISYNSVDNVKGKIYSLVPMLSYTLFNEKRLKPYFGIGAGIGYGSFSADKLSAEGTPYYQWSDGSIKNMPETFENHFIAKNTPFDNVYETKVYNGFSWYVPLRAGVNFLLTQNIVGGISYSYNITSDNYDGIDNGSLDAFNNVSVSIGYKFIKRPEMPKPLDVIIDVLVTDSITKEPLTNAHLSLYQITDTSRILIDSATSDTIGIAQLFYPENVNHFEIVTEKEKYYSKTTILPEHSHNNKHWKGENDVLEVELVSTWEDINLSGVVVDKFTEKPLDSVYVRLFENVDGNRLLVDSAITNENGDFNFTLDHTGDFDIEMDKRSYNSVKLELPEFESDLDLKEFLEEINPFVMLPEVKKGNVFRVDNIYFGFDKLDPLEESYPILDNIVSFLKDNPNVVIELSAHTDCEGSDKYNMKLSQGRANSCVQYLISKGIAPERLVSKGYGETMILNGCFKEGQCTEEENQVNRRVEVKVL